MIIDHESDDPETLQLLAEMAERYKVVHYQGQFNYAKMNNLALDYAGGEFPFVLFLNNDIEALDKGWIERMRSLAGRSDVGAVGPMLLYADDRIQHAGVLVGFNGSADHAHKFVDAFGPAGRNPGYNCSLTAVRDYSAVTAACMMMRTAIFASVGGFDESLTIGFNDTDLCLRVRAAGFAILYDGHTVLRHYESATRRGTGQLSHPEDTALFRERWKELFARGDEFYSPLLSPTGVDHILIDSDDCDLTSVTRVRPVTLRPLEQAPALATGGRAGKARARGNGARKRKARERK
jgi:GT2 family glycosyltransferase